MGTMSNSQSSGSSGDCHLNAYRMWANGQPSCLRESHFMDLDIELITDQEIRREKEKARKLRHSAWWMTKTQKGVCHYCKEEVGRGNLTMDHIVPLSRGGKSRKGNIVPACKECNNKKKYLLPVEWEEYLKTLSGY